MKRPLFIIALILIGFGIKAIAGNPDECYIRTIDAFYAGSDIKTGLTHTRIIFADGTYKAFRNRDIVGYKHHDKLFMLMPVVCNNTDTLCMEMMQYICAKSGCIVFKYCCSGEEERLTLAKKNYFFIFKEGKFYRRIGEDQTEALAAFGIKVI